jgi:PRELI-like family
LVASRGHLHGSLRYVSLRSSLGIVLIDEAIAQLFGGSEDAFVREISFVDPSTQTTTISSVNLSLSQFATCHEKILYSPAPGGRTAFHQTAEIQTRMVMWRTAADKLENWLAVRFEQNAQLGKVGFTDVLRQLWEDAKDKSPAGTPA